MRIELRAVWVLVCLTGLVACQPWGPKVPRAPAQPALNPRISAEGLVVSVERPRPDDAQAYVHLLIAPGDKRPIVLVLAPGWYLEQEGIRFEPNESVRVLGRRDGEKNIVVEQLEKGERSYVLRDEHEQPAWLR